MPLGVPALRGGIGGLAPPAPPRSLTMGGIPQAPQFSPQDLMTPEELASSSALDPILAPMGRGNFDENLALGMDEHDLDMLASDLIEMVDADKRSRQKWVDTVMRGAAVIGLTHFRWQEGEAPFKGASTVIHPMLAEAGVQSAARAVEELMPAKGPAKTVVMGEENEDKRAAADRVADHMNYQVMIEDEAYQKETNKLWLYCAWFGAAYRKAYHDPILDLNVLRFLRADELILPYTATCMETATRITHEFRLSPDDFKRYVAAKLYRHVEIQEPEEPEGGGVRDVIDESDAKTRVDDDQDLEHVIYEIDIARDLKGFEDTDLYGRPTGLPLPYTITVEKDSEKIVAIRRCWKDGDKLKKRRNRYAEYTYIPGLGVYGLGLLQLIGSLSDAGTDALRALLDSATFANMQGGFKAKDAFVKGGEIELTPGVWKDVDATADELAKSFYTPPFKEPSEALFKLLGFLTDLGRRFASTTDLQVGEGDAKAPVGTTIAMLEQGQKIYSSVHKRGHASVGVELRMLFDLNHEHIPEEGYPYSVPGDDLVVFKADYDTTMVSVVPVSDPNIFSQTQRIAQSQALYQMFKDDPRGWDGYKVKKRVCESLKIPDIDDVLLDDSKGPDPMDPVSENVAMITGRPVKAHEGENHPAHMAVHMAFMQHPQFGGIPQAHDILAPAMIAHLAEHLGLYYAEVMRKMGAAVPQLNLSTPPGKPMMAQGTQPPDINAGNSIAQQAAMTISQFMQTSGIQAPVNQDQENQAKADVRKTDADAFSSFAAGIKTIVEAGQTLQQVEVGLAALDPTLNAAPGSGAPPGGMADGGSATPQPGVAPPSPSASQGAIKTNP